MTKSCGCWRPYMLSPSMITSSNGNRARAIAICSPTSYSGALPLPVSPIAANFSESGRAGRRSCVRRCRAADDDDPE